jgi:hypothetical protein
MPLAIPTEQDELPIDQNPAAPKPSAQVVNDASQKLDSVYKNIQNEPLIEKIKAREEKLEALLGIETVEDDLKDAEREEKGEPDLERVRADPETTKPQQIALFNELLGYFNALLKTTYGPLGYLVKSNSEEILKLYGVDSDDDFYLKLDRSVIRVSSRRLEQMVIAGGGKRFVGERGLLINDPAETPNNVRVTDEVVSEIISAIKEKVAELQDSS